MQTSIGRAGGAELFFVCSQDEEKMLTSARPLAQGSGTQLPASFFQMRQGSVIIHKHPEGELRPSDSDIAMAEELAQRGIGSWMIDDDVEYIYIVAEAFASEENQEIDSAVLADMLLPGGMLSRLKPDFETRDAQLDMMEATVQAFNEDRIVVVEAGTGVGKSLAYLIPAFAWVLRNSERVVISTATINLQQQIVNKDIPTARSLFANEGGDDVKVVIAKGRNQYLCRQRLDELLKEEDLFSNEQLDALRQWADKTDSGERSDLGFNPEDSLWAKINADKDSCPDARCWRGGTCFFQQARRSLAAAQIIVTNHHLLFADLSIRSEGYGIDSTVILPPFQRLIVDEAHNIEAAATSYFSEELNRFQIHKYANRLLRTQKGKETGVIAYFRRRNELPVIEDGRIEEDLQAIRSHAGELDAAMLPFLEETPNIRLHSDATGGAAGGAGGEAGRKIAEGPAEGPVEKSLFARLHALQQSLLNCVKTINNIYLKLSDDDEASEDPRLSELRILISRLEGAAKFCGDFREYRSHPEFVYWFDRRRTGAGDRFVHFTATPIEVGELLEKVLFDPFPGIVLTSATLSVNRSIDFWQSRVGLQENERLIFHFLDSPFDYSNRVLLGIPGNAPAPGAENYVSWLGDFISRVMNISEGHALVLFTSYSMLADVYARCKPVLVERGISCLRQGDDDRDRLMGRFRDDSSSVLFATHSFWEGVDAPGDTLRVLIICRLPFKVPNEAVFLARTDAVLARGGNPFLELSLPEAVMKLKQGFGRLMRRKSDRGVVIITDHRIVSKFYGKVFINSLPPARLFSGSEEALCDEIEAVLYGGER